MKAQTDSSFELPEVFLNQMADLLGDEFNEFLASLQQPPKIGLRINTLKITRDQFIQISPYKLTPTLWSQSGFIVDEVEGEPMLIPPGKHPYHSAGLYYLQEPSAMCAGEALSPLPGEKVVDLAAAPGGKSTHLAGLMKNNGLLLANEIHPRRVWDLAENLERCGVTNAIITNETANKLADHFGEYFDRVMLDAPCSGEGMFRKSETARSEWKPGTPQSCAFRQHSLLEQAARLVKIGGSIAYTTCTFSPIENEAVLAGFLDTHPEIDLKALDHIPGLSPSRPEWINLVQNHKINRARRIWPHLAPGEGHFIAILVKHASTQSGGKGDSTIEQNTSRKTKISGKNQLSRRLLDNFVEANLTRSFAHDQVVLVGSYLYCIPKGAPDLAGLKVIHPGWWLGSIQSGRFIPSHALAMGISIDQARRIVPMNPGDRQVSAYLAGESFTYTGENGWVLVTLDGFPLGWGKRVQNIIKNYYPHGLRRQ